MKKLLIPLILLLPLAGCAIAPNRGAFTDTAKMANSGTEFPGQATVYFFRDPAAGLGGRTMHLIMDGVPVAGLFNATYVVFPAAPGDHKLLVDWGSRWMGATRGLEISTSLEKDKTYYFGFSTSIGFNSVNEAAFQIDAAGAQTREKTYTKATP